ncbi:F-box protein [Durusdinium trenchii]|uniref:F-box protein n=1 Tax=Durusdinium trenchii TaxID=1381693 RepID=A0ABP0HZ25_9DINO
MGAATGRVSTVRVPELRNYQLDCPDGRCPRSPVFAKGFSESTDAFNSSTSMAAGFVTVHNDAWETYRDDFVVQLRGLAGFEFWQGVRSRDDFEQLFAALEAKRSPLPRRPDFIQMSPWNWACYLRETRSELQACLDEALRGNLSEEHWRCFLLPLGFVCRVQHISEDLWATSSHAVLGLPIMGNILGFLEEPADVARLCYFTSRCLRQSSAPLCGPQWEQMYIDRWPALYQAQKYLSGLSHLDVDWKSMYRHTLAGQFEALLEVYDREKKLGFAMSCMLAKVTWDAQINCYIASYVSASQAKTMGGWKLQLHVVPERIPYHEGYRLRFCPPSARELLKPELVPPQASELPPGTGPTQRTRRVAQGYAYRASRLVETLLWFTLLERVRGGWQVLSCDAVAEGIPNLQPGQGVELQWKMPLSATQARESRAEHLGGSRARVTMIFDHFPSTSRWRRLQIVVGDGVVRQCAIGGWHGGVRAVTEAEKREWAAWCRKGSLTLGGVLGNTGTFFWMQNGHSWPGEAFELPRPVYTAQGAKKPCSASAEENRNERPQRAVGPEKMIQWLLERLFGANLFQKKSRLVVSPGFQRPKNLGYSKLSPGGLPPIVRPPDNLLGQMPKTRAGQWNVGHDAFSSASVWLENVARQGKRVGDRQTAEPVVYKGDMTLKEFKKMKEPVRRLIANAGALPARKLVKVQDDQALFEPLSKEERDMKVILQMISEKAAQRRREVGAKSEADGIFQPKLLVEPGWVTKPLV